MSTTTSWGHTHGGRPTLPIALTIGVVLAAATSLLTVAVHDGGVGVAVALGAAAFVPCSLFGWVAVVDRSSIRGAPKHPEASVESTWYDRAVRGAFHDTLIATGLGLAAISLVPALRNTSATPVLVLLLATITVDVAVRYRFIARREG